MPVANARADTAWLRSCAVESVCTRTSERSPSDGESLLATPRVERRAAAARGVDRRLHARVDLAGGHDARRPACARSRRRRRGCRRRRRARAAGRRDPRRAPACCSGARGFSCSWMRSGSWSSRAEDTGAQVRWRKGRLGVRSGACMSRPRRMAGTVVRRSGEPRSSRSSGPGCTSGRRRATSTFPPVPVAQARDRHRRRRRRARRRARDHDPADRRRQDEPAPPRTPPRRRDARAANRARVIKPQQRRTRRGRGAQAGRGRVRRRARRRARRSWSPRSRPRSSPTRASARAAGEMRPVDGPDDLRPHAAARRRRDDRRLRLLHRSRARSRRRRRNVGGRDRLPVPRGRRLRHVHLHLVQARAVPGRAADPRPAHGRAAPGGLSGARSQRSADGLRRERALYIATLSNAWL